MNSDILLSNLIIQLIQNPGSTENYEHIFDVIEQLSQVDASVVLLYEGDTLKPIALKGLDTSTLGRRFNIKEHPRFGVITKSKIPIHFPSDSKLPDPYDGLVEGVAGDLPIHSCVGIPLYYDEELLGVLTLDSLNPSAFDELDDEVLIFIAQCTALVLHLEQCAKHVAHFSDMNKGYKKKAHAAEIIGKSDVIKTLKQNISLVAPTDFTALIHGESGTGKELIAEQLHQQSQRSDDGLVYVNCAAIPEQLVESELFGHKKGAFTGAETNREGKFSLADKGTLFLDEIGELPLSAQSKILRALQSNEIQPVGYDRPVYVDVRIIAATNRDLKKESIEGRFREDLYHRLNVFPIQSPPLRDRHGDINLLSGFFLEKVKNKLNVDQIKMSSDVTIALNAYHWPGNVRELEHIVNRSALKAYAREYKTNIEFNVITIKTEDLEILESITASANEKNTLSKEEERLPLKQATDNFQKHMILKVLTDCEGNWTHAAKELHMDRANLIRLSKRLGVYITKKITTSLD
ncbi:nitric oxide reductase transcriptional regulator NorR [Vibrio sp.]|nr:nitric oxide reductase transcriptional regulator NorR [Vibrio sp.]